MSIAARVNTLVDRVIEEERITGAVVLVYQDGEPILEKAAGFADREAGLPAHLETIFRYASVTKPIVAVTALVMIEKGLLSSKTSSRNTCRGSGRRRPRASTLASPSAIC